MTQFLCQEQNQSFLSNFLVAKSAKMKPLAEPINLYFELYWDIKSKILLRELSPGARLGSIEALHRQYGMSHGTVRKAMEFLEAEDLVTRKVGIGTFVREDVDVPLRAYDNSLEELYNSLHDLKVEPISADWIDAPERIDILFKEHDDSIGNTRIFHIRRLCILKKDHRKRMITDIFLPCWIVEGVEIEQLSYSPVVDTIAKTKGIQLYHVHETLRPWLCNKASANILGVVTGTPLFHRTSVTTSRGGRVLFVHETLTTANSMEWEIFPKQT